MKRRDVLKNSALGTLGLGLLQSCGTANSLFETSQDLNRKAKNIIFMVSDGMSQGTFTMADLLSKRQFGKQSAWLNLNLDPRAKRALMDTASANSLVTDSAAGGSAWGGGKRVFNGRLNQDENGHCHTPILQKFKSAGKAVGCVTTVPITHATPASFCVCNESRRDQPGIAEQYLDLKFDVMLGGGEEFFDGSKREDGQDLFARFSQNGYSVARNKAELNEISNSEAPILGVFHQSALPYTIDHLNDETLQNNVPTLREMSMIAINKLKNNPKGFVMQIEGGKVDWAAHGNDVSGLLYDQIAFDETVAAVLDFAEKDGETLVIITTDHGNANPGLMYGKKADKNFDGLQKFLHSNEWVFNHVYSGINADEFRSILQEAQGIVINLEEATNLVKSINALSLDEMKKPHKLPFEQLANIQRNYTSVGWISMDHSADYVELTMFGPGSEMLKPFVNNYELHDFMLAATQVKN
jgi:alkaline phosphatase